MPGKAAKVTITERQMEVLEEIAASRTAAVRLVQRARIILLAFAKQNNEQISAVVDLNPLQVGRWRRRWQADWERLIQVECSESKATLRRAIELLLSDRPGRGRKPSFTSEQQAAIVAIACEDPDQTSDRPISHFTRREIADEAIRRGVVETISPTTVGAFLKSDGRSAASQQVLVVSKDRRSPSVGTASWRNLSGVSRGH